MNSALRPAWLAIDCSLISPAWVFLCGTPTVTESHWDLYACPQVAHQTHTRSFQWSMSAPIRKAFGQPAPTPIAPKRSSTNSSKKRKLVIPCPLSSVSAQQALHSFSTLFSSSSTSSSSSVSSSTSSSSSSSSSSQSSTLTPLQSKKRNVPPRPCLLASLLPSSTKHCYEGRLTLVDLPIQSVTYQEQVSVATRLGRYHRIVQCILQSCSSLQKRGFQLQAVIIEGYAMSMSPGQANMASLLYELGGILRYALMTELKFNPDHIIELSPTQAKKHWTGRGTATKQEMYDSFLYQGFFPDLTWCLHAPRLQTRLRTQHRQHPLLCKTYKPVEDLIDAWALLDCYWHQHLQNDKSN